MSLLQYSGVTFRRWSKFATKLMFELIDVRATYAVCTRIPTAFYFEVGFEVVVEMPTGYNAAMKCVASPYLLLYNRLVCKMANHPALQLLSRRQVPVLGYVLIIHIRICSNFGGPSDGGE